MNSFVAVLPLIIIAVLASSASAQTKVLGVWFAKNADEEYELARMYYYGDGVRQDVKKAAEWTRRAAKKGHVEAQLTLGAMYLDGEGVTAWSKKSSEWFMKAAQQGNDEGQYLIGSAYEQGYGVEQSFAQAVYWYTLSARQGYSYAKRDLARLCNSTDAPSNCP